MSIYLRESQASQAARQHSVYRALSNRSVRCALPVWTLRKHGAGQRLDHVVSCAGKHCAVIFVFKSCEEAVVGIITIRPYILLSLPDLMQIGGPLPPAFPLNCTTALKPSARVSVLQDALWPHKSRPNKGFRMVLFSQVAAKLRGRAKHSWPQL
jgi:hypothetical protein